MQEALRADSDQDFWSAPAPSARRINKFMAASVAIAGVTAIAISPVTPSLSEVQEKAVELTAIANPIVQLQESLTATLTNLALLSGENEDSSAAVALALSNPALYAGLAEFVGGNILNPVPLITQLASFQATYGERIETQTALSQAALQTAIDAFPTIIENTVGYLQTGQFVEAFSELNIYFLVQLLERPGVPLFQLFPIPGDVVGALPGGEIPAAVLDALLVRGQANGIVRALLAPSLTGILQVAEILDSVQVSLDAGDTEGAVSQLVNLPGKTLNAFVNGYVPSFPTRSQWQGILSPNGPLDYFLNDLPEGIANAINAVTATTGATSFTAPVDSQAKVSSTEVTPADETVTLSFSAGSDETITSAFVDTDLGGISTGTGDSDNGTDTTGSEDDDTDTTDTDTDTDTDTETTDTDTDTDTDTTDTDTDTTDKDKDNDNDNDNGSDGSDGSDGSGGDE